VTTKSKIDLAYAGVKMPRYARSQAAKYLVIQLHHGSITSFGVTRDRDFGLSGSGHEQI